jgi:hypothetical protein
MAVGRGAEFRLPATQLDHAENVLPAHPRIAEAALLGHAAPQRRAFLVSQAGGVKISVEILFSLVVSRHFVMLAAFFVQSHPPAFPVLVIVFDVHPNDGGHARKAVNHHGEQGAIAQAEKFGYVDRIQEQPLCLLKIPY